MTRIQPHPSLPNKVYGNHERRIRALEFRKDIDGPGMPPWYWPDVRSDGLYLDFGVDPGLGPYPTQPTDTTTMAWMIQTTDGTLWAGFPGGTGGPLDFGTVFAQGYIEVLTSGNVPLANVTNSDGVFTVLTTPSPGDILDFESTVIGGGYAYQLSTNTFWHFDVVGDGERSGGIMFVPNIPDMDAYAYSRGVSNQIRWNWPVVWDTGDVFAYTVMYPMKLD